MLAPLLDLKASSICVALRSLLTSLAERRGTVSCSVNSSWSEPVCISRERLPEIILLKGGIE